MPSLILRLEHLPHQQVASEPETSAESDSADDDAAADSGGWQSTSTAVQEAVAEEAEAQAAGLQAAGLPGAGLPAAEPTAPAASPPRVVEVAASERLATATPLSRWSAAVAAAHDACIVLDLNGIVVSISVASVELLGCGDRAIIGRHILEAISLVDFETGSPNPEYSPRITPLAVLDAPGLARSILRVRHEDGAIVTLDTSSAPIHDVTGHLLGSVTFLAPIPSR